MEIYYSVDFKKQFKKLPQRIQRLALAKEPMFRINPFNPSLRTHKISGKLQGIWSFSLDYKHRVLFRFLPDKTIIFISVGDHSIYR